MTIVPVLTARFADAFAFASVVHAAQMRKGTAIPYLSHLMGVTALVLEHGADEDTAIAALLHDAAEDRGGWPMLEQVRARFGDKVAAIVEACTDTFEDPKPAYRPRKQKYIEHLHDADLSVCLVAAADKLHNARAVLADLRSDGPAIWSRFNADATSQHWYYDSVTKVLAERLAGHSGSRLTDELRRVIAAIWTDDGQPRSLQL